MSTKETKRRNQNLKTKRMTNNTMPSNCAYFNSDLLSHPDRISGSDSLDDAIEVVGRYHCHKDTYGGEGVLLYGLKKTHGLTPNDYVTAYKQRPIANWSNLKRLYIIVNSMPYYLCFFILHIDAPEWERTLFEDLLNLGEKNTIHDKQIDGRRRSTPLRKFAEHCVTKLTLENQNKLRLLNDTLEDDDKIRLVYLVLRHGWDFVLDKICVGDPNCYEDLPLFNMPMEQFKTTYVVDVECILRRSAAMYGQYLDELDNAPRFFMKRAKAVGGMIAMVASKGKSNTDTTAADNNSNTNNNNTATRSLPTVAREKESDDVEEVGDMIRIVASPSRGFEKLDEDSTVLSISSPANIRTGKRRREENSSNTNNNDTATKSHMQNPAERSSSLRDEKKKKKKKKKKKMKKRKKKKKKKSNDDSDDDATVENDFGDDDGNNNNKNKHFRPEKDNIESKEDEISDADDGNVNFGDDSSMVRILLSLFRLFCSILFIGFTYFPFLKLCRKFYSVGRNG